MWNAVAQLQVEFAAALAVAAAVLVQRFSSQNKEAEAAAWCGPSRCRS